ncbi:MAG TPA: NlpC/P60 family protein [Xanthobacteraceae bacterium]|jgi:cell wall-associated NlpC family hydrolase|nr:NlpC/P60 family protein [Xanthobacteraceae bacterium]
MNELDPRVTPARPDLAAKHLEGKVSASRFVDGTLRELAVPQVPLRKTPSHETPLETEALKGEGFVVYDDNGEGWCWGQLVNDGYVGWLPSSALRVPSKKPTHRVSALRTPAFPGPSIKLPPVELFPFGSMLAIECAGTELAETVDGLHVPVRHLSPVDSHETDFVAVAERFVGSPYLWGGKTNNGIDCSGLVQVALMACGKASPRDSDMQERELGTGIALDADVSNLRRGDLLFWPGHVAIACGSSHIVHANAFHMAVAIEPVADAVRRIAGTGVALRSVRRIS